MTRSKEWAGYILLSGKKRPIHLLLFVLTMMMGSVSFGKDKIKQGTHRMVMVVNVPTLDEINKSVDRVKMTASDIDEQSLRDGSFAVGIVYCCQDKISENEKVVFYVPDNLSVAFTDMVEVVIGRPRNSKKDDDGLYSRAGSIRGNLESATGECRWDPEDARMWMSIVFCDWMEEEGWVYQKGLNKSWYKPVSQQH